MPLATGEPWIISLGKSVSTPGCRFSSQPPGGYLSAAATTLPVVTCGRARTATSGLAQSRPEGDYTHRPNARPGFHSVGQFTCGVSHAANVALRESHGIDRPLDPCWASTEADNWPRQLAYSAWFNTAALPGRTSTRPRLFPPAGRVPQAAATSRPGVAQVPSGNQVRRDDRWPGGVIVRVSSTGRQTANLVGDRPELRNRPSHGGPFSGGPAIGRTLVGELPGIPIGERNVPKDGGAKQSYRESARQRVAASESALENSTGKRSI